MQNENPKAESANHESTQDNHAYEDWFTLDDITISLPDSYSTRGIHLDVPANGTLG